ncbi:hypothetical protein AC1031_016353 [Aphanomyces cochlioides]|nr:hypothetical protein AC1031_016353 [Aphanomyces cochlioides]
MEAKRWKALRYYQAIEGKKTVVSLKKGSVVEGTVVTFNGRQNLVGLIDMQSPLGVYPRAVVKLSDIQSWEVSLTPDQALALLRLN